MANAGVRDGSYEELRIKDIQDYKDGCKSITSYGDDLKEYTTFITAEGSQALEEYFEFRKKNGDELTSDSWVFTSTDQAKPISSDVCSIRSGSGDGPLEILDRAGDLIKFFPTAMPTTVPIQYFLPLLLLGSFPFTNDAAT